MKAAEPLCFDDLVQATHEGEVRDVAAWLGHALQEGLVEETQSEDGRRCYRLRARGRRILSLHRRRIAA